MARVTALNREHFVYLTLGLAVFLTPVLLLLGRTWVSAGLTFSWTEIFMVWRALGLFVVVFLIHNSLLAPLLVRRGKRRLYFVLAACLAAVVVAFQCVMEPVATPLQQLDPSGHVVWLRDLSRGGAPLMPVYFGQGSVLVLLLTLGVFGMNIGVKLYFKSDEDNKRMERLEKQNLEQQLQYLKYQVNPHFLMNTLNNIHALIDIDPERAKSTVLELSKLMRYVLHEGSESLVPLQDEVAFLAHYMSLMRLRYTDQVSIRADFPEEVPSLRVPPLLLVTFVENAFKHGVSYQQESFVAVDIQVDGSRLHFHCRNSKAPRANDTQGGVGLGNVRRRLQLIYDTDYSLHIDDGAAVYDVRLDIPLCH